MHWITCLKMKMMSENIIFDNISIISFIINVFIS